MMYIVHHPEADNIPDLCGEGAKDMLLCRFDAPLDEMKIIMERIADQRMQRYELTTGKLYLSERGRKIVYVLEPKQS